MVDSAERLINLALFLARSREGVTAEECRTAGLGYTEDQDPDAFARMFERDKDVLRAAGLPIEVDRGRGTEAYRLDPSAYAAPVQLSADELAALAAAGAAMVHDPGFPLGEDLRYALAKLTAYADAPAPAVAARITDETPEEQGEAAALLATAVAARKRTRFGYTNVAGRSGAREVEPYALFLSEGRWYLVGRDTARGEMRTYAVARMTDLSTNDGRPRSPDFERPADFDVAAFVLLPFQYGEPVRTATLRFSPDAAWRAERLTANHGTLDPQGDGSMLWRVPVADERRLLRWVVENGPGIVPVDADLRRRLADGLRKVVALHAAG